MASPSPSGRSLSERCLQRQWQGSHLASKWIEHESESFEGRRAEQRVVSRFANDDERIAAPSSILERRSRQLAPDDIAWSVIRFLYRLVPVLPIDVTIDFRIDWRVIAFSAGAAWWLWLPEHLGDNDRAIRADWNLVTAGFYDTIGTPVVRGRPFDVRDDATTRRVVIVNETLAAGVWPGVDPIGRTLVFGREQSQTLEVVGVAKDAKYQTIGEAPQPFVYVPLAQHYHPEMWLLLRTSGATALPALRRLLAELDPTLAIVRASTLAEATAFGLLPSRLAAWLAGIAGGVGLLLSIVGLYGVIAYNVSRRAREFGIWMAVGAQRRRIISMVLRQGMAIAGTGVVIGIALAVAGARLFGSFLYGVEPLDGPSFVAAAALMAMLALAASSIPARKAVSVNPVETLRAD